MRTSFAVAEGVHRVDHAHTNCYLITDGDAVTVVDACFPGTWRAVRRALESLGRAPGDVKALLLTHGHFDHVGFARRLAGHGVPVLVHEDDRQLAAHPYRYRPEQNRALFPLGHPGSLPILASMVAAGALTVRGIRTDATFADGAVLPVPGRPRVLHLPGHTAGQCGFHLPDRSVLFSGDALVTLDPYTGRRGPRLVAPAATADSRQAADSLGNLTGLAADLVLPGHGEPWTGGLAAAVRHAQQEWATTAA